jgi:hypothetical protein
MTHARFAVAAIVASVTIAVGLPELIKQWWNRADRAGTASRAKLSNPRLRRTAWWGWEDSNF